LKIIQREHIDTKKWDALVSSSSDNAVFSMSTYLDAVAENWCVLTDDNYSKGIALPYTVRLGIKVVYTPIFVRYLEWFGEEIENLETIKTLIQNEFQQGQLNSNINFENKKSDEFIFQISDIQEEQVINSQVKRMLSKFDKAGFTIHLEADEAEILKIINAELPQKVKSLNDKSLTSLEALVKSLKMNQLLKVVAVKKENTLVGGLFLVEFNHSLLYLKGAFTPDSKKEGAMYGVMQYAIELAKKHTKRFDFGGSRVEGVRRFNVNLGGKDVTYHSFEWDNSPLWFKILKRAKTAWKRK
jgi:hypothetical protein